MVWQGRVHFRIQTFLAWKTYLSHGGKSPFFWWIKLNIPNLPSSYIFLTFLHVLLGVHWSKECIWLYVNIPTFTTSCPEFFYLSFPWFQRPEIEEGGPPGRLQVWEFYLIKFLQTYQWTSTFFSNVSLRLGRETTAKNKKQDNSETLYPHTLKISRYKVGCGWCSL